MDMPKVYLNSNDFAKKWLSLDPSQRLVDRAMGEEGFQTLLGDGVVYVHDAQAPDQ